MEALVAVGLASNIVSFVDFGLRVLSTGKDIHASIDGLTTTHSQLKTTANRLNNLCDTLRSERSATTESKCKHDLAIAEIAGDCIAVGQELHSLLEKLASQRHTKWSSIKKAIQSAWKDSKIQQMSARLQQYATALHVHLTASLTDSRSALSSGLANLVDQHRQLGIALRCSVEQQKKEIIDALKHGQESLSRGLCDMSRTQQVLLATAEKTLDFAKERKVIKSLKFVQIRNRFNNIHESSEGTYDWIYNDEHLNQRVLFSEWLREGQGTYFLTGKPGSGKSTMMKHVHEHPKTASLLREWAVDSTLVTVAYFFWNSGVALQKSQEGLFRTLLHDILRDHPDLAHVEIAGGLHGEAQTLDELLLNEPSIDHNALVKCLENIFRSTEARLKFCIFIDGIDEYAGYPTDIVDAIKLLTKTSNVKLCVSSRPWNTFEREFKGTGKYYLEMHKHTVDDIQRFIRQSLEKDNLFKEAVAWDSRFSDLTQLLVTKAEGVFLWALLVTRKIRQSLINGDTIEHCIKEVDAMSSDLDDFFTHMLHAIPSSYQEEASKAILMALTAEEPIPVLTVSMALDPAKDAVKDSINPITELKLAQHSEQARKQLKARCQDLFEPATEYKSHSWMTKQKLEVLHRSIYDWLRLPKIHKQLQSGVPYDFDPNLQICEGYLLQLKAMPTISTQLGQTLDELVHGFCRHAKALEDQKSPKLATLLRGLRRTMITMRIRSFPQINWAQYSSLRLEIPRSMSKAGSGDPLLPFAVRWRINSYVNAHCQFPARDVTGADNAQNMDGYSPLYLTLIEQMAAMNDAEDLSSHSETVKLLVNRGADPNQPCGDGRETVWSRFIAALEWARSKKRAPLRLHLIDILEILVKGGANANAGVPLRGGYSLDLRAITKASFNKDDMARIDSILAQHEVGGWERLTGWFSIAKADQRDRECSEYEDEDDDEWQIITSPSKLETLIMDTQVALSRAARLLMS